MLVEDGANQLISQFGEEIEVVSMGEGEFEDENDPIYHSSAQTQGSSSTHKVRLYTTPSDEQLETYGFDENTESMIYTTDDIADQGDKVIYEPGDTDWVVGRKETNQLGNGPYLWVYQLIGE